MPRTTSELVIGLLLNEYDAENEPDVTPFIDSASVLIDEVVACAARKGKTLTDEAAEILERWVAAHLYQAPDPGYQEKQTEKAKGVYNTITGKGLEGTRFGQNALLIDSTGCLRGINNNARARLRWMGKPPSEQIPYYDRD
jgi:hypothetical protein